MDRRVKASTLSIFTDTSLIVLKLGLGWWTGSLALRADGLHSLSDLVVSLVVLGIILLRKRVEKREAPPSRALRAIELAVPLIISLIIFSMGAWVFVELQQGKMDLPQDRLWIGIVGASIAALLAYLISEMKIRVGREENVPALVADGYHSRMDMFSSIGVAIALLGQRANLEVDGIAAVLIALMIMSTGFETLIMGIRGFHDQEARSIFLPELLTKRVATLVKRIGGIFGVELHPTSWRARCSAGWSRHKNPLLSTVFLAGLVAYLLSGLTQIGPDEGGVKLRMGRATGELLEPGLHFLWPWPFEEVWRYQPERVERVEVGFRTLSWLADSSPGTWDTRHERLGYIKLQNESLTITGDEFLIDVSLVVHYKLDDPIKARMKVADLDALIRGVTQARVKSMTAKLPLDQLLIRDTKKLLLPLERGVQESLNDYDAGVEVVSLSFHDMHPPVEVVPAFRSIFSALEDKHQALSHASAFRNERLPGARAEAFSSTTLAQARASELILEAEGERARFTSANEAFKAHPEITKVRLYLEAVGQSLSKVEKIIATGDINPGAYQRWLFAPNSDAKREEAP